MGMVVVVFVWWCECSGVCGGAEVVVWWFGGIVMFLVEEGWPN